MTAIPKASFKSHIAKRIVSNPGVLAPLRAGRFGLNRLLGQAPVLELYYQAGDPHSHLAAQWLRKNAQRITLPIKIRLVADSEAELYPEADKQRQFALTDAAMVAPAYGLAFSPHAMLPSTENRLLASRCLHTAPDLPTFLEHEEQLVPALFSGQNIDATNAQSIEATQQTLANNASRRVQLGHYLPGMWQLQGRWYWGVDRMSHLQAHLQSLNALVGHDALLTCQAELAHLPPSDNEQPLEFFFSFRSPYSYLAAVKLQQVLAELPVKVVIRPVLPMAMRGFKVPSRKRLYIARDVHREALRLGVPFGQIADPLGDGALRCLTAFTLAEDTQQQIDFLCAASRAVWSRGIDVAKDEGLKYVCQQARMDWNAVHNKLHAGFDLESAEANRRDLFDNGLWGVPSYHCGNLVTWGRDRWWLMEEYLRRGAQA